MPEDKKHPLIITPTGFLVSSGAGHVLLETRTEEVEALLPSLRLLLRASPDEARSLAATLLRKADEAEGGQPRH